VHSRQTQHICVAAMSFIFVNFKFSSLQALYK